jgi:pimeloyl-ACP methyl ester carboxylesterase
VSTLHDFPTIDAFGHLPTPDVVDVVGVDLPVGRLTAYRVVPDGDSKGTVLIVPGFTGSKEDFRTFLPLLRDAGWTAVVISRRGQADSAAPNDTASYTLAAEAADVVAVARLLEDGATVHLVGHSLGGIIARAAAVHDPTAFRSVTMFCSGPHGWAHRMYDALHFVPEFGLAALWDSGNPLWAGRPDDELPDAERFGRYRFGFTSPLSVLGGATILEDLDDTTDDLRATGLPVLVAHGVADGAWPIPWQEDMATRLGAEYVVIPDSAHGPQEENPPATARVFDSFFSKH